MTDQLEELLLGQEPENDEPVWWKDGRRHPRPGRPVELPGESPRQSREEPDTEGTARKQEQERPERKERAVAQEWIQEQTRGWTAQELERVHRIARRAVQVSAGKETGQQNRQRSELLAGADRFPVLKDSPAAGRQGLTAQIDMQFRRDARRYDGRLGLL